MLPAVLSRPTQSQAVSLGKFGTSSTWGRWGLIEGSSSLSVIAIPVLTGLQSISRVGWRLLQQALSQVSSYRCRTWLSSLDHLVDVLRVEVCRKEIFWLWVSLTQFTGKIFLLMCNLCKIGLIKTNLHGSDLGLFHYLLGLKYHGNRYSAHA